MAAVIAANRAASRMRSSGDSEESPQQPAFNPYGDIPSDFILAGPWETRLDPELLNFFKIPSKTRTKNFEESDDRSNVYVTVFYKYNDKAYVTLYPYKKTYTNTLAGEPPIAIAQENIQAIYERYPHAEILSYLTLDQIKACRNARSAWLYKSMGTDGRIDIITDQGILGIDAGPFKGTVAAFKRIPTLLNTMRIWPQESPISCYDPNTQKTKPVKYGPSDESSGGKRRRKSKKVKKTKRRKSKKTKKTKRRKSHKK